jgi:hypothetical protein
MYLVFRSNWSTRAVKRHLPFCEYSIYGTERQIGTGKSARRPRVPNALWLPSGRNADAAKYANFAKLFGIAGGVKILIWRWLVLLSA